MKHALYRINNLKTIFVKYRSQNTTYDKNNENNENKIRFNIFKLHMFIHWRTFIRLYNNAQNFDTSYEKAIYKFLLKQFFFKMNKFKEWDQQILMHNIRYYNLIFMKDFIIYTKIKTTSIVSQKFKKEITICSRNSMNMLITFNTSDWTRLFIIRKNNKH